MKNLDFGRAAPVLFEECSESTNTELKALAREGAAQGTVLIASRQSAGRGRLGRCFVSPDGGLYLSALWQLGAPDESVLTLTPTAAVAVRAAIQSTCGIATDIKWPNDLLYRQKKLCGILTESVISGHEQSVVLGIGINVNLRQADIPRELQDKAGSILSLTGEQTDIMVLARAVVSELDRMFEAWTLNKAFALEQYRDSCISLGRTVTDGEGRRGKAIGIADDYSLKVAFDCGEENIRFGEASVEGLY